MDYYPTFISGGFGIQRFLHHGSGGDGGSTRGEICGDCSAPRLNESSYMKKTTNKAPATVMKKQG
jgi:hypothetical protein